MTATTPATHPVPEPAAEPGGALVVGEALVDVVRRPGAADVEHPGGSAANVAVAQIGRAHV